MQIQRLGSVAILLSCISAAPSDVSLKREAKPEVGDYSVWALLADKREAKPEVGDDSVWALLADKREAKRETKLGVGDSSA
ncbi:hypothetical protein E4U32_003233 [Claviceps aff. humidiphila group G2b]|nr:hypothetical protein E4U32_003233 [Claviceps aff. humidiphila group G2b]